MATKAKDLMSPPFLSTKERERLLSTPALTMSERVQRIETLGQRISGYVQFMCQVDSLTGSSNEVKEVGVTAFYDRLVIVENQLHRIQEELRLA